MYYALKKHVVDGTDFLLLTRTPCGSPWHPINHQPHCYHQSFGTSLRVTEQQKLTTYETNFQTSWDELSSHQAEAVSLNLASRYGYITTINHGEGAIIAKVGFKLRFNAI